MRLIAIILAAAALGAGPAMAQKSLYQPKLDACYKPGLKPVDRITACTEALDAIPADFDRSGWDRGGALMTRSSGKLDLKDFDGAIADADQAVMFSFGERHAQNNACWNRAVANRDLMGAKALCDAAIAQNPDDPDQFDSRGLLSLRMGKWQDAKTAYQKVLDLDRSRLSALYARGLAELALGETEIGERDIKLIDERKPEVRKEYAGYALTPEAMKAKAPKTPAAKSN